MGFALLVAAEPTQTLARRRRRDEVEDAPPDEAVLFMLRSLLDRVRLCLLRLLLCDCWERADETDESSSSSLL